MSSVCAEFPFLFEDFEFVFEDTGSNLDQYINKHLLYNRIGERFNPWETTEQGIGVSQIPIARGSWNINNQPVDFMLGDAYLPDVPDELNGDILNSLIDEPFSKEFIDSLHGPSPSSLLPQVSLSPLKSLIPLPTSEPSENRKTWDQIKEVPQTQIMEEEKVKRPKSKFANKNRKPRKLTKVQLRNLEIEAAYADYVKIDNIPEFNRALKDDEIPLSIQKIIKVARRRKKNRQYARCSRERQFNRQFNIQFKK